jgi:hypothetical protein
MAPILARRAPASFAIPGVTRAMSVVARHLRSSQTEYAFVVGLPGFEPGTS